MNKLEKKLDALIHALGFDVETLNTKTYGHARELNHSERMFNGTRGELEFQGEGLYKEVTRHTNYKLTKRTDPLDVLYDGVTLRQLAENIIELKCNPLLPTENKWIKYPKASFEAVVDWFGFQAERKNEHRYIILGVEVSLDE